MKIIHTISKSLSVRWNEIGKNQYGSEVRRVFALCCSLFKFLDSKEVLLSTYNKLLSLKILYSHQFGTIEEDTQILDIRENVSYVYLF